MIYIDLQENKKNITCRKSLIFLRLTIIHNNDKNFAALRFPTKKNIYGNTKILSFITYHLSLITLAPIAAVTPEHEWERWRIRLGDSLA